MHRRTSTCWRPSPSRRRTACAAPRWRRMPSTPVWHRRRFHARQRPAPLGGRGERSLQHPARPGTCHLHCRRGTLSDPRLVRHFSQAGAGGKIPYQVRQPGGGGTDAGTIHKARAGVPSLSISVPHRYTHTAVLLARLEDWKNTPRPAACRLEPHATRVCWTGDRR